MPTPFPPDLTARPHSTTVERVMTASPAAIYDAWTRDFDKWFAQPGELVMQPEVGTTGGGTRTTGASWSSRRTCACG